MILECAKLDREINYFVDVVQQVTSEVSESNLAWSKHKWKACLPSYKMN